MKVVLAAAFGAAMMVSHAVAAATPEGVWLSEDRDTKVQIVNCGGKLCAKVVWLGEPNDPDTGKPKTDIHNPDPKKRSRPLLGLTVVNGMSPNGGDTWSGHIYNADDGHTYKAHLTLDGANTARVKGCALVVLCKTHTWTRSD